MPEGPELHLASRFINQVCNGRIFGKIVKSEISKNPVVEAPSPAFSITATSRGKEIKLTLHKHSSLADKHKQTENKSLDILVTFGLAGKFEFVKPEDLAKHAHLNFFTTDKEPNMVLSFVDYMRFGKWTPGSDFSYKERGPCVLTDYTAFRAHVLKNISSSAFNRPICELLLNQKYFNGIGNYLRAEILHRAGIPPFVCGRDVLEPYAAETVVKSEKPDIIELCHQLPNEVLALEGSWYDAKDRENLANAFNKWLQCYYQDNMKNMADHNKRTIWYSGPAGPMAPKEQVVRGKIKRKPRHKKKKNNSDEEDENTEDDQSPDKQSQRSDKKMKAKSPKKKVKLEKLEQDKIENGAAVKKTSTKTVDMSAINEISENLHGTRLTRRRLKDIIELKDKVEDSITVKREDKFKVNGEGKRRRKRSARKVLNNDATYLNSSLQNK